MSNWAMKLSRLTVLTTMLNCLAGFAQAQTCPASNPPPIAPDGRYTVTQPVATQFVVSDMQTGLMWKQCPEGLTGATCATGSISVMNWTSALSTANASTHAGFSDWRLPNINELQSLLETSCFNPSINTVRFPANGNGAYWSASTFAPAPVNAWRVIFSDGIHDSVAAKTTANPIRLVRNNVTVPTAPNIGTAAPGNTQVSVAFTPPGSDGGTPIFGYRAVCGAQSNSGNVSPIVVTGLSNGVPVSCTVVAINGVGSSSASLASNVVMPASMPGALDSLNLNIVGSFVYASAVQPDGKTIIGGQFSSVLGQARNNIARLNADGTLDAGFNPNANSSVESIALQADGQILLGGTFTTIAGSTRNRIARVAADGTLDAGFNPNANGLVRSIVVQTDGQILLGGDFTTVGGSTRNRIARVAANGTLDAGFDPNANATVYSIAVQADGQILLGGSFITIGGSTRNRIARVAANGTLDASFTPNANFDVISIAVQANGQILFVGFFTTVNGVTRDRIARVAANGTLDMGFNPVPNSNVFSIALQADGRILFGGEFTTVGGTPRNRIARVAADGMLDAGFNPNVNGDVRSIALQADGQILLGDVFTTVGGSPRNRFARLLNDPATQSLSAVDSTQVLWTRGGSAPELGQATFELSTNGGVSYTPLGGIAMRVGSTANWQLTGLSLPANGQVRARGRTAGGFGNGSSGLVEQVAVFNFGPGSVEALNLNIVGSFVLASAVQPDGKTIIGGAFSSVLGQARNNIARLNADGTLDAGFNPNANGLVYSVAVQADGQILLGGNFTTVGGTTRGYIARVAANGTLDAGFDPNASGEVRSIAVQQDGQILLAGAFSSVGGSARTNIARVAANGTLDAGFSPDSNLIVYSIALQADGQILLGGLFTTVNSTPRNYIARVAANGTLDAGFNPDANGPVNSISVQADGQILLGGNFSTVAGTPRNRIARVAANGTLDAGFNPDSFSAVNSIAVQADGQILLGGDFTSLGGSPRNYIARVAANGTLDAGFNPNANSGVNSIAVQADGQILLGGNFTTVGGSTRNLFARLLNDPATQSLTAVNATQVLWTRGGSAPDVSQTTFELSTNGGVSYTPLGGTATRVGSTANWQLIGLSLPASGQLRARGRTPGSGSSGLVQQVASFSFVPDITSNLEAFYDCNGNAGIPDGIRDNTANARHLTKTLNAPAFDPVLFSANARSGQACDFNARTKLQSAISAFTQSNTVTYAFWVNTGRVSGQKIMQSVTGADLSNAEQNLIDFTVAVAPQKFRVFGNSPDPNLKFRDTDATAAINDPVTLDQWHHLAVTSTGTLAGVELYIDGVQVSSLLGGMAPLTGTDVFDLATTFYLGARSTTPPAGPANFNGKLDDVRIYSRVLTPVDIAELAAPPGMGEISDTIISEDSSAINLPFVINDLQTPAAALVVTAVSSNPALLPNANVTVGGAGANRMLTLVPVADAFGASTVTVTVTDGDLRTETQSFVLTVSAVNDAPSFVAGANQTTFEDAGAISVPGWATAIDDGDGATQSLNFTVTYISGTIGISAFAISPTGTLSYTPVPNSFGSASFSVRLNDNGGTANGGVDQSAPQTFTISVVPVNDAPVFTAGPNQSVLEDAGPQSIANWATGIDDADAGEVQSVTFTVTPISGTVNFSVFPTVSPTGTLSYTTDIDSVGSATFSVRLDDTGGTANGGVNQSALQNFTVNVGPVNDAPSFGVGAAISPHFEDPGPQSVPGWAIAVDDGDPETVQTLNFVVTPISGTLTFSMPPTVSLAGTLSYTPAPNSFGSATFSVRLDDNGGTANGGVNQSAAQNLTINVGAVNDAPSFVVGANQSVFENAGAVSVSGWASAIDDGDPETAQTLSFVVTPLTGTVGFSVFPTVSPSGTLSYTTAPDSNGNATFSVRLDDDGGTLNGGVNQSAAQNFTVTVGSVNSAPAFVAGANQSVFEDVGAVSVPGWASAIDDGDPELMQTLNFIVTPIAGTVNFSVFPALSPTGTLSYTTFPDSVGSVTFSVRINDNGGTANGGVNQSAAQVFTINVGPVNDAPSFVIGANQTTFEDIGAVTVPGWATVDDGDPEVVQTLSFEITAISGTVTFSAGPTISPSGALSYTPTPNSFGSATITIRVNDDGGLANGGVNQSATQNFTISVIAVNDAPSFVAGTNQNVLEDAGSVTVPGWATAINWNDGGVVQAVTFTVTPISGTVNFSVLPTVSPTGTLSYTPAPNSAGSATFSVVAMDNGGTANGGVDQSPPQNFTIDVGTVNDAPSFVVGANQNSLEDEGAVGVPNFATAIDDGDPESPQNLNFTLISNSNATLFSVAPSISPTGALSYTSLANASGSATISLRLNDDGGTANGGVNQSAPQNFTITVAPVNDLPSFVVSLTQVLPPGSQVLLPGSNTAQTINNWATAISDGDAEFTQSLSFNVTNDRNSMFTAQPSVAANGTLSFTPNGTAGLANISVSLTDDASAGGAALTTAVQTFSIIVRGVPAVSIVEHSPAATVVGEPFSVRVRVDDPNSTFQVSGQVAVELTISGGTPVQCTLAPIPAPVGAAEATCNNVFSPLGSAKFVKASYIGDAVFVPGDTSIVHPVTPAATRITILEDLPDPSMSDSPVAVRYMLEVLPPSLSSISSLRGDIRLSYGQTDSSLTPFSSTNPIAIITMQGNGSNPLTASYTGDGNFLGSTVAAAEPHMLFGGSISDLSVEISNSRRFVPIGGETTYQVRVRNLGSVSNNAQLDAFVPEGLDNYQWTCSASVGSSCNPASGVGTIVAGVNLLPNGLVTYTILADVIAEEAALVRNYVSLSPPDGIPLNDSATDTDIVAVFVEGFED